MTCRVGRVGGREQTRGRISKGEGEKKRLKKKKGREKEDEEEMDKDIGDGKMRTEFVKERGCAATRKGKCKMAEE